MLTQGSPRQLCASTSRDFVWGASPAKNPGEKVKEFCLMAPWQDIFWVRIQMGKTMELTALMGTIRKILIWTVRLIRVSWE